MMAGHVTGLLCSRLEKRERKREQKRERVGGTCRLSLIKIDLLDG